MGDELGVLDNYHLKEALQGAVKRLGERCGKAAIDLLSTRFIESIDASPDDEYSYIWRSAIEDHEPDTHKDSYRTILVDSIRDAALGLVDSNSKDKSEVLKTLLQSPYVTLVRIGIFICGERYGSVGTHFWEVFRPQWMIEIPYWHELFWFIKKGFPRFSASERQQFIDGVIDVKGNWKDLASSQEWDEILRRDLLFPAVGFGDAEVELLFETLVKRRGTVREHPDFHTYSKSGFVGENSPVTSDQIINMSDVELIDLMRNFVPDTKSWDGATYRGFAENLSGAVRASADGFANRMRLFANSARPYQHGLLSGLRERWAEDKRDIDWSATLSIIQSIVTAGELRRDLNAEQHKGWEPSVYWVVSDIADLIKAGASSPDRPLQPLEYEKCIEILQTILGMIGPTSAGKSEDAVIDAINSPRGKTLEAVINVALAMRRHEVMTGQKIPAVWRAVGPIFESELQSSESGQNEEFATLVGMYCANLHYLNPNWVEGNFDRLFSLSNENAWNCATQGIVHQRHLYRWLFEKIKNGGHLRRMIFAKRTDDSVSKKALQFLGLAYLEECEQLAQPGLMLDLITSVHFNELMQLCWFFWTLRDGLEKSEIRRRRILNFWSQVATAIRTKGNSQPALQSELNLLSIFIQEITPEIELIWCEAAPHADIRHHGNNLVE